MNEPEYRKVYVDVTVLMRKDGTLLPKSFRWEDGEKYPIDRVLRHSCASVLLAQGVPMKQIQEWLGHSDMSTTANIYSHLDAVSKADTGAAMSKALGRGEMIKTTV